MLEPRIWYDFLTFKWPTLYTYLSLWQSVCVTVYVLGDISGTLHVVNVETFD